MSEQFVYGCPSPAEMPLQIAYQRVMFSWKTPAIVMFAWWGRRKRVGNVLLGE
ncbi:MULTISPECIES: hypothetical protein [unclassified Corynebacterium]|uniref:hypothetical protein n=1 Tax=unclassified Corynebacterium TaxID=2624378 RepID=UPI001EF46B05|nr:MULTISPECIES: hypothetical protein [unclassified Corynebacterium]MCG7290205.1 hypothetical protein [Corynebacterium sp. ACRPZ]MCG7294288.1 hypothetical protein [Corynebacterium sp. ACRPY]